MIVKVVTGSLAELFCGRSPPCASARGV